MDLLNERFKTVLETRGFELKRTEHASSFHYQGRLALDENMLVDFELLVPKSDQREVVQIVFNRLATCRDHKDKLLWLKHLNEINTHNGLHYYFCLGDDGRVFARYMLPVDPDRTDILLELLQIGSHLMHQVRLDQWVPQFSDD